jgi:hypothetical protein
MGHVDYQHGDHFDGNKLNNQRENLLPSTVSENQQNRHVLNRNNKTGFRGIWYDKRRDRWAASICVESRSKFLGRFPTAREAAIAYNTAALKYYTRPQLNEVD